MTTKLRRVGLRLVIGGIIAAGASYCAMRGYVQYEAHLARSILAEASRLRIGDSENSVLPLVRRYGGYKWTPEPLPPSEQCIDKDECDYQQIRVSDYKYELGTSPFGTNTANAGRLRRGIWAARGAVPASVRSALGMRDWGSIVEISIRKGRVQSVSAMTLVEGRSEWLGQKWELAPEMPHYDMPPRPYAIGATNLTMWNGATFGGTMITNYITPQATDEQAETARQVNAGCLTSIRGCKDLCDVAPRALQYLDQHPDASWNIVPLKCP